MVKKDVFLFVGVLMVVFSMIHFTSSATSCTGGVDDIILRLYPQTPLTNTHGALWNETSNGYDEVICYSDFFGLPVPSNPHVSSGSNTVLFLSDTYNAHAEGPLGGNYLEEVYYGNLICTLQAGACTGPGEVPVLRLSDTTNAHLEVVSEANYPQTICCSAGGGVCGDGTQDPGEQCDDNNLINGDGCSDTCQITVECSDGVDNDLDGDTDFAGGTGDNGCADDFDNNETAYCGDGLTQNPNDDGTGGTTGTGDEECDGGASCNSDCTLVVAGAVNWENLIGDVITSANQGDTVRAVYVGAGGTGDTFEIWEEDDGPLTGDGADIIDNSVGVFQGEDSLDGLDLIYDWDIPMPGEIIGDTSDEDSFEAYFEVNALESGRLSISGEDDDPIDGGPISPACGTRFNNLLTVQDINFTVFDSDSLIDVTVTVTEGDGTVSYTNTWFDTADVNFGVSQHAFTVAGTTEIRVYAENDDGDKFGTISNVIVTHPTNIGVSYFAACIDEPRNFEHIGTDYTFFNASSSRGFTRNSGSGCVGFCAQNDVYLPDTVTNPPGGANILPLHFDWTFSDEQVHSGYGGGRANDISWEFYKYFGQYGDNWADLTVSA